MSRGRSIIVGVGLVAFYFADLNATYAWRSVVLPIILGLSLFALAVWFVLLFHRKGISQHTDSSDIGGPGGFGGGDGGC